MKYPNYVHSTCVEECESCPVHPPQSMKSQQTVDEPLSSTPRSNEEQSASLLLSLTNQATQEWRTTSSTALPSAPGLSLSTRSLNPACACIVSMTASSIVDNGEYFFDDDFSVPFDANLREENNNTDEVGGDTSSLLFTSAEGETATQLWSRSEGEEESGSFLSTSGGEGGEPVEDPNPALETLLKRPMRGEYRLTYVNAAGNRRNVGASASMEFQSATTSGGTAADSECSSGSNLSTWASLARSNSPSVPRRDDSSAPSTLKASRRLTTWSQLRSSSSRESMPKEVQEEEKKPAAKLTTWKQMKKVASAKFVSWRELKQVVRPTEVAEPAPNVGSSPTPVQMRQSSGEPVRSRSTQGRARSADNRNRYSGTLLELFKRTHAYDGGAAVEELTAPAKTSPGLLRRSYSISPVRSSCLEAAQTSPAEWFGRLFSDNSLSPVCSFEASSQHRRKKGYSSGKVFKHFGAQFPPPLPPGVKLRPRSQSQQLYPENSKIAPSAIQHPLPESGRRASTGQATTVNTKRITYPNAQALKVPLPAKSKRLVSSAWGNIGTNSQSLMALPDLSFLSRHLSRLKEQEGIIAPSPSPSTPKLRRSNSCAASVNRNDSPPDSGINTSADSIPVTYDLIQLDGEPLTGPSSRFRARPASSEPDLLTADLSPIIGGRRGGGMKPLKPCLKATNESLTTNSTSTESDGSGDAVGGRGTPTTGEFRAKKSVSFSEKILFHQAPGAAKVGGEGKSRPLSLVDNLRVIPNKVGLYGDEELFMAYAPVCSPETSPVKETGPSIGERPSSEVDRRYQALVAEVIQSVHRMIAHFSADGSGVNGPPMNALLPPLITLVCDGLNVSSGRAAGLFAKFRNRLWPVVEESCRQGVSHRALSEVLREVKALPGITTEKTKFKAFVCACLNSKCLPMWLNAVATNESLLRRHFCEDAFLRQAAGSQRELFADLITSLELLLGLPFRLDVSFEAKRTSHQSPTPAATTVPVPGPQPLRARHDIKVKQHLPISPSNRGWQGKSSVRDGGKTRIPVVASPGRIASQGRGREENGGV